MITNSLPATKEAPSAAVATLEAVLTTQLAVAMAEEGGEAPRHPWRTDLVSEFGREDLVKRVLADTWPWGGLEARETDPDRLITPDRLFEMDEHGDRLCDLKRASRARRHRPHTDICRSAAACRRQDGSESG